MYVHRGGNAKILVLIFSTSLSMCKALGSSVLKHAIISLIYVPFIKKYGRFLSSNTRSQHDFEAVAPGVEGVRRDKYPLNVEKKAHPVHSNSVRKKAWDIAI